MKKLFILFTALLILLISCKKQIEKDTIIRAAYNISSINTIIGDTIDYEISIISKNNIDYKFEDISFDSRDNKCRIISVKN